MTESYKAIRLVNMKPKWVILDESGKIINRNPKKEDLKDLNREIRGSQDTRTVIYYTDDELLSYLSKFYDENGRSPSQNDFSNNPEYPVCKTYWNRFGSWSNALKLVGLDVDSMITKGIVETCQQKARLSEIRVINHFKNKPIDLAGYDYTSPCDGICPNGKTYDVKSSSLHRGKYYGFVTRNKYKEKIDIYYLLGYSENYATLEHAWRIPGYMAERCYFRISMILSKRKNRNIENMREYEITDKIKEIINEKIE